MALTPLPTLLSSTLSPAAAAACVPPKSCINHHTLIYLNVVFLARFLWFYILINLYPLWPCGRYFFFFNAAKSMLHFFFGFLRLIEEDGVVLLGFYLVIYWVLGY